MDFRYVVRLLKHAILLVLDLFHNPKKSALFAKNCPFVATFLAKLEGFQEKSLGFTRLWNKSTKLLQVYFLRCTMGVFRCQEVAGKFFLGKGFPYAYHQSP